MNQIGTKNLLKLNQHAFTGSRMIIEKNIEFSNIKSISTVQRATGAQRHSEADQRKCSEQRLVT